MSKVGFNWCQNYDPIQFGVRSGIQLVSEVVTQLCLKWIFIGVRKGFLMVSDRDPIGVRSGGSD